MQQYRLNYPLLIGLGVGAVIASVAIFGLWKFQIERKSDVLLSEADKAWEAKDYRTAAQYYSNYLSIHPDDDKTRVKRAEAWANRMEQDDVGIEEIGIAIRILESTVRELPDAMEVQRRLVALYGRMRRYQDALDHLNYMLDKEPNDAELQAMRAEYLVRSGNIDDAATYSFKLIGYDPKTDSFDSTKATAPKDIPVYANLARILRHNKDKADLADQVMEELIKANPDSAAAFLARGNYWMAAEEKERGQEDIEKAYQLDPKDSDVLLVMADNAAREKQYDKARELLDTGKKLHPDEPRFYQASADLESRQQKYEEALAEVEAGLKAVGTQKGGVLLFYKAEVQLHNKDLEGVRDTVAQMKNAGFRPEILEWHEARILLAEEKWHEAMEALNRLRPRMTDVADMATQIDFFLGLCYERLGYQEQALDSFEAVLKVDPKNEPALAGRQRVLAMLDPDKAWTESDALPKELNLELEKPQDKRNVAKINDLIKKLIDQRKLEPFQAKMFQVQMALVLQDYATARKLLGEANELKPNNLQVHLAAVTVARLDPKVGPQKAMEMWERVSKQFGDSAEMRVTKADNLMALKGEQLKPELGALLAGVDTWKPEQKIALWGGMAQRYLNLGMMDEAKQYLTMVADQRPNELPTRLALFQLSLETGDEEGMKEAQKRILQIVKDESDSTYLYTDIRRKLLHIRRGMLGPEALSGIRQAIDNALQQRPEWHELWLAKGDLELYGNRPMAALDCYANAEKFGRPNPRAVAQHIKLLALFGRYREAGELLDRIPEPSRQALLDQYYTEILFRTNKVNDAIRAAKADAEAAPDDPAKQFWYGQLLSRSARMPELTPEQKKARSTEAIEVLRRAVELEPELPDAWYALIALNADLGNRDAARQALRDAQLSLAGDNLQLFLAKSYEMLGQWFDAETMYRAVYEMDPKDARRAQQLAAYYLGPVYPLGDRWEKATPLLNKIMRTAEEVDSNGKKVVPPNDPNVLWARRMAAQMLATTKDYQNLLKAEKLLASGSQDGMLSVEDRLELAQILASRSEPDSRKKAANLLEEVSDIQSLSEQGEITLGQLYYVMGDWTKCRNQMLRTIGRFQKSTAARESYIDMLLSKNDPRYYNEASDVLRKLRELAPESRSTFALTVKLAGKVGKQEGARAELLRRIPKIPDVTKLSDADAQSLAFMAGLLVELDDLDNAEKIFQQLAQRDPSLQLALAEFIGTHRDVGKSFELLDKLKGSSDINVVLNVGINTLRKRRDDVGDKYDPQLQAWLDRALSENPDSITLQMLQADFYDVQKKYDEAAKCWTKLLARSDVDGLRRAIVLNNLSFLIALGGSVGNGDLDPLKLIEEAEQILGPNADILDTKAVVLIQMKRYAEAIEDLKLSVTDKPTGAKYFHMVLAHLGAGQNRDAIAAWDAAESHGLTRDELNRMEHARYDQVKSQIEQLRAGGTSVSQNSSSRRAE